MIIDHQFSSLKFHFQNWKFIMVQRDLNYGCDIAIADVLYVYDLSIEIWCTYCENDIEAKFYMKNNMGMSRNHHYVKFLL